MHRTYLVEHLNTVLRICYLTAHKYTMLRPISYNVLGVPLLPCKQILVC